jgi:site-specific recombinase XerD
MKLQTICERYAAFRKTLGERFEVNGRQLKAFCRAMAPNIDIADVSAEKVNTFLVGKGPLTTSWYVRHNALLGFYRYAISRGLVATSPLPLADTLSLLIPFVAQQVHKQVDQISVIDVSPDGVRLFLRHLEESRKCTVATRNQRLAAIHSLARLVGLHSPEHIEWCGQLRAIPPKRAPRPTITYLEKSEMDALLSAPDQSTDQGRRDHALLLFLYNTGARADEAAQVKILDLLLAHSSRDHSLVQVRGKGNKLRRCPLWPQTVVELSSLIANRPSSDHVFLNRCGQPITRFGIHSMVERYTQRTLAGMPSLAIEQVSPHTIRHTTATHLLRAGVDINTIRAWLGHVSLNTTNVYAEVDLEMKAKALATCEIRGAVPPKPWKENVALMQFLRSL